MQWPTFFSHQLKTLLLNRVVELTGDVTPDMRAIAEADLIVTTPEKWDGVSRSWQNRSYVQKVAILVIDEIHLLGKLCQIQLTKKMSDIAEGNHFGNVHCVT